MFSKSFNFKKIGREETDNEPNGLFWKVTDSFRFRNIRMVQSSEFGNMIID